MKNILRVLVVFSCLHFATNIAAADGPLAWKYQTSGGIYAAPLVHNNVLYIGSTDSVLYAINAANGTEVWHYKTDNPIRSTAAIEGNIVCVESGNKLYGLDLQGNLLWLDTLCSGSVTNQFDPYDYFHSSPNIVDGVAYVGSEKGKVLGINIQTGAVVFQCQTQNTNNGIRVKPLIHNNKIYFGDWDGIFYAYDLTTGLKVWEYNTFPDRLWTGGLPSVTTSPVMFNGNVFFAGRSCILYALNAETGAKQWSYLEPGGGLWLVGGPTISDSLLFLGTSNQYLLRAIHAVTGECIWEKKVDGRVNCTPSVNDDYVYIGTGVEPADNAGSIYAFDKRTGELKNRYMVNAMVHSSPVIMDTNLYVGSADRNIYAFNKQALLTNPYPMSKFRESSNITLGTLGRDTTIVLHIDNEGDGKDSITVLWIGRVTPRSAINVDPKAFSIAPQSSQDLSIDINASQLTANSYSFVIQFTSLKCLETTILSRMVSFQVTSSTSIGSSDETLPGEWSLRQNYPNPFNATTIIRYDLPRSCPVVLKIYNQIGQEIETFIDGYQTAGKHSIQWHADKLTSGIYFYRLQADQYSETRKMLLLR